MTRQRPHEPGDDVRDRDVKPDMPGLRGPEVEALYASGAAWLRGDALDR